MIHQDDFVFLIFVVEQLGNELISLNVRPGVINCLLNVVLFVFVGLSQVEEEELCIDTDWELFSLDGY